MNCNRRSISCVAVFILAMNFAVISGIPVDEDVPSTAAVTTVTEVQDTKDEIPADKTGSSPFTTTKSVTPELPLADEPPKEPNTESRPELSSSTTTLLKETTTVPPLIHNSETPPGTVPSSSTTTIVVAPITETTPSTTTKKSAATSVYSVPFSCLVASAILMLLR